MMNLNLSLRSLENFFVGLFLIATLLLVGCGDDPEPPNEEELITTMIVTLTPQDGGPTVTLNFKDLDGDGPGAPVFTYSPNTGGENPAAILAASTVYNATIELLNEAENPVENITEEIEDEADEHLFCFTHTGLNLTFDYADTEADYLGSGSAVVGLATTWTTGEASSGTVKIILRHQPGTKTGDCPGSGETDIEVTFNIVIQ
jgi:hypothetical protein